MIKECSTCLLDFEAKNNQQSYCTTKCRNTANSLRKRATCDDMWLPKMVELTQEDLSSELWLPIEGTQYSISNMGRVRNGVLRILKPHKNKIDKYWYISLKGKTLKVHRLVALHFIPNIDNKPFVDHRFGNKDDNRHHVLRWVTFKENIENAWDNGNYDSKGEKSAMSILNESDVKEIKHLLAKKTSCREIAEKYNVTNWAIHNIKQGRQWKHVTI